MQPQQKELMKLAKDTCGSFVRQAWLFSLVRWNFLSVTGQLGTTWLPGPVFPCPNSPLPRSQKQAAAAKYLVTSDKVWTHNGLLTSEWRARVTLWMGKIFPIQTHDVHNATKKEKAHPWCQAINIYNNMLITF